MARRFTAACLVGAAPALGMFTWILNAGRSDFFQRAGFTGNFYDTQARSLLHGHWDVPRAVMAFEGIAWHGKTYMYFGPFPAVLRLPFVWLGSGLDGRLTQVSMLVAFAVALLGASRLLWRARQLLRPGAPFGIGEGLITAGWVLFVGVGSALLFPASQLLAYHEAELWGTALALVGLDAVIGVVLRPSWWRFIVATVLATFAITTRPSVGLGPAVALGVLAVAELLTPWWYQGEPRSSWPRVRAAVPAGIAALVPVVVYGLVNEVKFGSVFNVPLDHQVFSRIDANRQAVLRSNGGSLFNVRYVPTTLLQYLRPDALRIWHLFPFVDFTTWKANVFLGTRFDLIDQSSSIPATMPAFALLAIGAAVVLLWRRRASRLVLRSVLPVVSGAAVAVIPTLVIGYVANRYLLDFLPLVLIPAAIAAQLVLRLLSTAPRRQRRHLLLPVSGGLALLFAFGAWTNVALALSYQRLTWGPPAARDSYINFEEKFAATLGTPGYTVHHFRVLPAHATPSELAVTGACDAVYWGDANHKWEPVETGPAAVALRTRVWLNPRAASLGKPATLLRVGAGLGAYLVTMRVTPTGQAVLAIGGIGHSDPTPPVPVPLGPPMVVDAVFDHQLRTTVIRLNGREVLFAANQLVPPGPPVVEVGLSRPRLVETAHALPIPTPLCDRFRTAPTLSVPARDPGRLRRPSPSPWRADRRKRIAGA